MPTLFITQHGCVIRQCTISANQHISVISLITANNCNTTTKEYEITKNLTLLANNSVLNTNDINLPLNKLYAKIVDKNINEDLNITLIPKLKGGKGGFGNNLRTGNKRKQLPSDDSLMRNAYGQRVGAQRDRELLRQYEQDLRAQQRNDGNGHLNNVTTVRHAPPIRQQQQQQQRQRSTQPPVNSYTAVKDLVVTNNPPEFGNTAAPKQNAFQASILKLQERLKKEVSSSSPSSDGSNSSNSNNDAQDKQTTESVHLDNTTTTTTVDNTIQATTTTTTTTMASTSSTSAKVTNVAPPSTFVDYGLGFDAYSSSDDEDGDSD